MPTDQEYCWVTMQSAQGTAPQQPASGGSPPKSSLRRYFDSQLKATVVQIHQGDCYVSGEPDEVLATVLGSCISACVFDPIAGCGGMNHFLLPAGRASDSGNGASLSLRYGSFAMEQLINAVLRAGGARDRIQIKIFGGANVISGMSDVGHRNASFVEEFIAAEGFKIAGKHLRGNWPRKVQFFPHGGQVRMREIKSGATNKIFEREIQSGPRIATPSDSGSIELFD